MRRMSRLITALLILLSAAGVVIFVRFLQQEKALDAARQAQVAKLNEELRPINEKRKELQEQDKEWLRVLESEKNGTPCVLLCFNTMEEELYETMYDMMEQYGFRGNFVMRNGRMPSYDEGVIDPEEFSEILDSSWEYLLAVGDEKEPTENAREERPWMTEESETETEEAAEEEAQDNRSFLERVDDCLAVYDEYQMERPITLFCTKEQYESVSDAKVADRGFQMACVLNEEEFPTAGEQGEKLWVIDAGLYKQKDLKLESTISNAIQNEKSMVIVINEVVKTSKNAAYDLSMTKFGSLLIYLKNLEEQGMVNILTFSEFYQYGEWQEKSYEDLVAQYASFRRDMNQQIGELDAQEQSIVDSLRITESQE